MGRGGVSRRLRWFSAGAASAIAATLDIRKHGLAVGEVVMCDTGSEDEDNHRFAQDVAAWLGTSIVTLKSDEYESTWDVWESTGWVSGPNGARCTGEQKVAPRLAYQRPDDVHIFGYTADSNDVARAKLLRETYPELTIETPLIERGLTKAACRALLAKVGIAEPRSYAWGFPNANCLESGCAKAVSPRYWALHRKMKPEGFARTAAICRELGVRLAIVGRETDAEGKVHNIRAFIDDIPLDTPTTEAVAPACDFLCHIAEQDIAA
jgi:hypothetical protein